MASSRTRSVAPHSPGPSIEGTDGAMASSDVRCSRQAEGPGSGIAVGATAGVTGLAGAAGTAAVPGFSADVEIPMAENGRGRGMGTSCAAARSQAAAARMMAPMRLTFSDFRPHCGFIAAARGRLGLHIVSRVILVRNGPGAFRRRRLRAWYHGERGALRTGAARGACCGDRAVCARPRPRLVAWQDAHHPAGLLGAPLLRPAGATG